MRGFAVPVSHRNGGNIDKDRSVCGTLRRETPGTIWSFAGWPRQVKGQERGVVEQVCPYIRVLMAGAIWEEEQSPCGVDLGQREGAKGPRSGVESMAQGVFKKERT